MLYTTAAVVALLPTFGVATRYLSGPDNAQAISKQALQKSGGAAGKTNLATSMFAVSSSNGNSLPASKQDFPKGDSPQKNGNAGIADGVNDCGFSNFVQLTEDDGYSQASVEDCLALMHSIKDDREWIITQTLQTIAQSGSCAFQAVVSQGQGQGLLAALGNADVIDLTNNSITQFGDDGYVACHGGFGMYTSAAGAMPCDSPNLSSGEQVFVDWLITRGKGGGSGSTGGSTGGSTRGPTGGSSRGPTHGSSGQPSYPQDTDTTGNDDDDYIETNLEQDDDSSGGQRRGRFAVRAVRF